MIFTRAQLDTVLLSKNVETNLEMLNSNNVLAYMFPEVKALVGFGGGDTGHKDLWDHTKKVVAQCVPKILVRWAALYHDVGKVRCFRRDAQGVISFHNHEVKSAELFDRAAERTRLFKKEEAHWIHFLIYHLGYVEGYESEWQDSAVRRIHKHAGDHFDDLVALSRADITTKHQEKRQKHLHRMHEFRERALEIARVDAIPPALPKGLGNALSAEFDIPPSPYLGDVMKALKEAVEEGALPRQPSFEECFDYVRTKGLNRMV